MNQKILLVEDEAIIAITTSKILEKHDFEVLTAHNGEKAIEMAEEDPDISLILMDIDLGKGIDGTEAARNILRNHDLPIIFRTSHSEKEYVDRVKEITRYGYVLKNSGEFVLLEAITMAYELFEAHNKLERANTVWSETFDAIQDIVTVISKDHELVHINKAGVESLGIPYDEIIGRKCYELVHNTKEPITACPCAQGLKTGESAINEHEENGRFYELAAWPIFDPKDNSIRSFVHIVRDITERMKNDAIL